MSGKQTVTVIVPVYNQEARLPACLKELLRFRPGKYELEILLINDGSTDGSASVCRKYAQKDIRVKYFSQSNRGVSSARNLGLSNASGKYIFFLDADDCLAPDTISRVTEFFDRVYEDTDLVTYPIETIYDGKILKPHFRYRYLKESGVYDLREHPYIGQTTMNIAVKNKFQDNLLFDEKQTFSEDQKYCCEVLKEKLKMGFCAEGKYRYYRNRESSSGKLSGACYIFEQCMAFFETLFAEYEEVPIAFQGLYVNDVYWKLVSNILFPYHYGKEDYAKAVSRIAGLLKRCGNEVILEHPQMDFFEKYYLLRLKGKDSLQCYVRQGIYGLCDGNRQVTAANAVELVITKAAVRNGMAEIDGFLKSVFFQFYREKPTLCAVENNGRIIRKLPLERSSHSYYLSREQTQHFWSMRYYCRPEQVANMHFEAEAGNFWFPVSYYFMPRTPFSHNYGRYSWQKDNILIEIDGNNVFHFSKTMNEGTTRKNQSRKKENNDKGKKKIGNKKEKKEVGNKKEKRNGNNKKQDKKKRTEGKERIWLYYDCKGVACDNGRLQFEHDIERQDGVKRYYIVSDRQQTAGGKRNPHFVSFGSRKHKKLLFKAEKIITAYIEENNILPFAPKEYDRHAGKFHFETIYLQHGVLHIDMPWKYSPEKIMADKVVVSTVQEAGRFRKNGFRKEELWECKMPRFDLLARTENKNRRILYAPTWREYLIGKGKDGIWEPLDKKFRESAYYQKITRFLYSGRLESLLEESGYAMDVKLHPIFSCYRKFFPETGKHIALTGHIDIREEGKYDLFITDFSSFLYDFLYLKIPILTYLPDKTEVKAGMNGYRNWGGEDLFWKEPAEEPETLLERLERFLRGEELVWPEADFFDGGCARENIYRKLMMS